MSWTAHLLLFEKNVGGDYDGWKVVKVIPSHAGLSRWHGEAGDGIGWVANPAQIPSPYAWGPSNLVYKWQGKNVIVKETSHKRYEIIAVPKDVKVYASDNDATHAYMAAKAHN